MLALVVCLLLLGGELHAGVAQSAAAVAQEFLRCTGSGDMACAVKLFHFPPEYTAAQLHSDSAGVQAALELFGQEFGRITNPEATTNADTFIDVGIGGADAPYWQKHPDSSVIKYAVQFDKEGPGLIAIEACHLGEKWQIRSVHYGLPAARSDAKPRIDAIYAKMLALP